MLDIFNILCLRHHHDTIWIGTHEVSTCSSAHVKCVRRIHTSAIGQSSPGPAILTGSLHPSVTAERPSEISCTGSTSIGAASEAAGVVGTPAGTPEDLFADPALILRWILCISVLSFVDIFLQFQAYQKLLLNYIYGYVIFVNYRKKCINISTIQFVKIFYFILKKFTYFYITLRVSDID